MDSPAVYLNATYRPDLQGLRAVAIGLVVLAHAGVPLFAAGYIGVDIFFVLSGFLITRLLDHDLRNTGRIRFATFYAKRLQRLLPALIVMLMGTSVAARYLLSPNEALAMTGSMPFAIFWLSNCYFSFQTTGYFDELSGKDLFLHTWSLGVEEQFYLLWPLLLALLAKYATERRAYVLGALIVISFAFCQYWTFTHPHAAFYLMPSRLWELGLGAWTYFFCARQGHTTKVAVLSGWPLLLTGLLLIVASALAIPKNIAYPGLWALLPALGAALVIVAGSQLTHATNNPLGHKSLTWLGDRSYSLYLWHWPIITLGFARGLQGQPEMVLALLLLSLLFAMASYRLVEYPFWKGRISGAQPRRVVMVSVLVMLIGLLQQTQGVREMKQTNAKASVAAAQTVDAPVIYSMACDTWYFTAKVTPCVFNAEKPTRTAVLLGDSIGVQWFSAIQTAFAGSDWRLVVLTKSACPMVDQEFFYARIGQVYKVCSQWRAAILEELQNLKPEVIVVGSASSYDFTEAQWIEGSARVLQRLATAAKVVLTIPATPALGFDGPGCVARTASAEGNAANPGACIARNAVQSVERFRSYLAQAASAFKNVHLVDLNDLACPHGDCNAVTAEGIVVFRDNQHLTDTFVRANAARIRARLHNVLTRAGVPIGPVAAVTAN